MKRNKQGVSLIVLVITIIVMIILASAVMISLSNNGIIGKANESVDESNLKEAKQIAALAWAEAYLDKVQNIKQHVRNKLTENGVNIDKFEIKFTERGVDVFEKVIVPDDWKSSISMITQDGVPVPKGFVASTHSSEDDKNEGLVIYALTKDEIANNVTEIPYTESHQTSLETRNQFVWVPVDSDDFEDLFVRTTYEEETLSPRLGTGYWELVLIANNMVSQDTDDDNIADYVSAYTLTEATAMYASVKKYGGFYIARYEAGKDDDGDVSVTMGKYPYNEIFWGYSMADETGGAVDVSRAFYPRTSDEYGVISTLTYGVQWDRTLAWWKELNTSFDLTKSTSYGVYLDTEISLSQYNTGAKCFSLDEFAWGPVIAKAAGDAYITTTGAYTNANVYNIYDMAGNFREWTMEGSSTDRRIYRGGDYAAYGYRYRVTSRGTWDPYDEYQFEDCFRPSLYIK